MKFDTRLISRLLAIFLSISLLFTGSCKPAGLLPGEATSYQGTKLTPIAKQRNNALKGTQFLDKDKYRLVVDGTVENTLNMTYADLLALPQESRLIVLNCVEGWSFTAKWTGPTLASVFEKAKLKPEAKIVIFHAADAEGYTSLDLSYILDKDVMIALNLNDVTLPPDRGFPFQVVAEGKFGYKWAKWVERIEISDLRDYEYRGYWEGRGYSNNASIDGPAFDFPVYPFD